MLNRLNYFFSKTPAIIFLFLYTAGFVYGKNSATKTNSAGSVHLYRNYLPLFYISPQSEPLSALLYGDFISQKGGDRDENARKYGIRGAAGFYYQDRFELASHSNIHLSLAGLQAYREHFLWQKKISRKPALLANFNYSLRHEPFSLSLGGGRNFYVLDSYGLLFSGFSYLAKISLRYSGLFLSFRTMALQESEIIQGNRKDIGRGEKVAGLTLSAYQFWFLANIKFLSYTLNEPFVMADGFWQERQGFSPRGYFFYHAIEAKTRPFLKRVSLAAGYFRVHGKRYRKENNLQVFARIDTTAAALVYGVLDYRGKNFFHRLAGLRASKDSKQDTRADAYSPIRSRPWLLGGSASFFLQHSLISVQKSNFQDWYQTERSFTAGGLEMAGYHLLHHPIDRLQLGGHLNVANCFLGKGAELIVVANFYPVFINGFFSFALTKAYLKNHNPDSFLLEEWKVAAKYREFSRIYAASSIQF